jgi:glycosyltransferase involved in cell wall biosynthesis
MSQLAPSTIKRDSKSGEGGKSLLSVIILAYNEELNLPDCLASLCGLNCCVWLVDSGSTDRTIEIAQGQGVEVRSHPFENYAAQRNWALKHLPIDTPWVLNMDADERLTPELVDEINTILMEPAHSVSGFLLRKRTVFMGRWIRHGGHYPSYHLRLFRNGCGKCEDRLYDQHFLVTGKVERLRNDYIDVIASSLSAWSVRHVKWAGMEAREVTTGDAGGQVRPSLVGDPIQRRRWWRKTYAAWPIFGRAFLYWWYRYFLKFGILDGVEGLIFHLLQGFWFRFLVDAMIWEQRRSAPRSR